MLFVNLSHQVSLLCCTTFLPLYIFSKQFFNIYCFLVHNLIILFSCWLGSPLIWIKTLFIYLFLCFMLKWVHKYLLNEGLNLSQDAFYPCIFGSWWVASHNILFFNCSLVYLYPQRCVLIVVIWSVLYLITMQNIY